MSTIPELLEEFHLLLGVFYRDPINNFIGGCVRFFLTFLFCYIGNDSSTDSYLYGSNFSDLCPVVFSNESLKSSIKFHESWGIMLITNGTIVVSRIFLWIDAWEQQRNFLLQNTLDWNALRRPTYRYDGRHKKHDCCGRLKC